MKKMNTIFKTMLLAVVVLVMAQSCIPTTPGGNPTPTSGTFNVGINDFGFLNFTKDIQSKIVVVDGDSLGFVLRKNPYVTLCEILSVNFKSSTNNTYEFLSLKNSNQLVSLPLGKSISNVLDSNYQWSSAETQMTQFLISGYERFDKTFGLSGCLPLVGPYIESGFFTGDNYLVFRKLKPTGYLYYWIKVSHLQIYILSNGNLSVLNGKYQMNSIVTGQ